jgi:16S rRNA (cytosine967-C5)-methyltransferase
MVREIAWRILRSGSPAPLREIDRAARENGLEPRDRGLLRRLVGTETRRRATLRAIAGRFATGKPDADLAAHLHLGFVQLFFLDQIPDHAAVGETVGAVRRTLGPRKAGYVNAVLRAAIAARRPGSSGDPRRDLALREVHLSEPFLPDPAEHPYLWMESALSIPAPLARRWAARYGEERAKALALSALAEPDLSLRVLGPRDEIARALAELGCSPRSGGHAHILLVPTEHTEKALASELFSSGKITVQGETALRSAELLHASPGERLLDACAAPGGKTAVLAASGARILACDASLDRLLRVSGGLRRLALRERVDFVVCDAAQSLAPDSFDGVLVDVPCSNTGVLAQRPEARWRFGPASMRSLAELQERILSECAARVKPGGRVVYSTCSLEPEENRRRIEAFLLRNSNFALEEEIEALPDPVSSIGPTDGGYAARLRRT